MEPSNPILMKALTHHLYTHPKYAKVLEWGKLLAITGGAQAIVQALGLVSGILVIRLLPTQEYALYTLANTMLGTMILLADGGISTGVMAQGGQVWKDREKLGAVLATGLDLRRKFAIYIILLSGPFLFYLLLINGASPFTASCIVVAIIPSFLTSLSNALFQIVPKLLQDIIPLQRNQVEANVGRLILLSISIFFIPMASVAVLSAGLPQIWANIRLKAIANKFVDIKQKSNPVVRKEILLVVSRFLPGVIYYCASGQITIWIISFLGSTASVAQAGALSRLSAVLNLISILLSTLITPRFSRLPNNKNLILSRYLQIQAGLLILSASIISLVWLFPSEVLWILGKKYSTLKHEVVLSTIVSCLNLMIGTTLGLYTSKGWTLNPIITIPIDILAIIIGVLFVDISTLQGILTLTILIAIVQIILHNSYCFLKIGRIHNTEV